MYLVETPNELARPSAADYDYAARALRDAVSAGAIQWDEFERMLDQAYGAATLAELRALTGSLRIPLRREVDGPRRPRFGLVGLVTSVLSVAGVLIFFAVGAHPATKNPSPVPAAPTISTVRAPRAAVSTTAAAPVVTTSQTPTGLPVASNTPLAPGQTAAVPAQCVTTVPYEQTQPICLDEVYQSLLPADPAPCIAIAGLELQARSSAASYGHVHIDLDLQGGQAVVPAGTGSASGKVTGIFTQSGTGIVWFSKGHQYTLGQLFLEWGQPVTATGQIGSMRADFGHPVTWFVNGAAVREPAKVVLHNHDEIQAFQDLAGARIAPTSSFACPPGY